jgi:hypothetical protein
VCQRGQHRRARASACIRILLAAPRLP